MGQPVALVDSTNTRQTLADCCGNARAQGARAGTTLAEARALCPGLVDVAHEPQRDLRALEAFGRWLMARFSPVVCVEPPDALFLEVGGCEKLFGGLDRLLDLALDSIKRLNITASLVIAPTPGAAWAISRVCPAASGHLIRAEQLRDVLLRLPPSTLRIAPSVSGALERVGIDTIGRLLSLPRQTLPARFGVDLLRRLDQALGVVPEAGIPLPHRTPVRAEFEFDGSVECLETIWLTLKKLVHQIVLDLTRRGCGARQVKLRLRQTYKLPIEKQIALSRPSRDPAGLFNLLCCALETLKADDGFTAVELAVPVFEPLPEPQIALLGGEDHVAETELDHLIERLVVRMGQDAVVRVRMHESHVPEQACVYTRVMDRAIATGTPRSEKHLRPPIDVRVEPSAPRPLCLLNTPEQIGVIVSPSQDREGRPVLFNRNGKVHRLTQAIGPERICGQWWDGRNKTRDYFDVEDDAGRRFWIFRVLQTWTWYLHGRFE